MHPVRDTVAIHQIGKLDLDGDAVRARGAVVNSDPGIVSRGEFGKGRVGAEQFAVGTRVLKIVRLQGDRLDASKVRS